MDVRMWIIGRIRALADIRAISLDAKDLRSRCRIAVVDDRAFQQAETLRSLGYDLTEVGDIRDLAAVAEYPIVICDIRGVGKSLGSQYEGAFVGQEIKRRYPEKIVLLYTGVSFNPSYSLLVRECDGVLKKDIGPEEWVTELDQAIKKVSDPAVVWQRLRDRLLVADVELATVLKVEQAYIRSVLKRKGSDLKRTLNAVGLVEDAPALTDGVIRAAEAVTKLLIALKG